ncbi:hypothetical protein OIU77_029247 [Salix suchowensis]|uniref:Uncharacterized protein n=1 Tax=Salix suchowensis TaxID=1278906 RepID=A0ABQ9BKC9_9ROSI|nr:hypothetical protein OIU77_029247 [Salix suchowensis]
MILITMKKLKPLIWRRKCGTSFTVLGFGGAHLKEVHDGCCMSGAWYKLMGHGIVLWWSERVQMWDFLNLTVIDWICILKGRVQMQIGFSCGPT